jgi:hypothetical protein
VVVKKKEVSADELAVFQTQLISIMTLTSSCLQVYDVTMTKPLTQAGGTMTGIIWRPFTA